MALEWFIFRDASTIISGREPCSSIEKGKRSGVVEEWERTCKS